jgi:hypothetical protein
MHRIPYGTLHLGNQNEFGIPEQIHEDAKWDILNQQVLEAFSNADIFKPGPYGVLLDQLELSLVRIVAMGCTAGVFYSEYCALSDSSIIIRIYFIPKSYIGLNRQFDGISAHRLPHEIGWVLNHISTASCHWSACPVDGSSCGNYKSWLNPVVSLLSPIEWVYILTIIKAQ